jgi:hypothetical protein
MTTTRHALKVRIARPHQRRAHPQLEELESRTLLSASSGIDWQGLLATPTLDSVTPQASVVGRGLTPGTIRQAYGFSNITLGNGVTANGKGQTIAIVTAYNDPTIALDLHTFDQAFGLADPPNFTQISPYGSAGTNPLWSIETSLDVEWAHAMAPGANILLVQANSNSLGDLLGAVNYARSQPAVTVVSMSWGIPETPAELFLDTYFTTPTGKTSPVTFVAASGDYGSAGSSAWPSISTNVLAVGGTTLSLSSTGAYQGETAWIDSGGEVSLYEARPSYQAGFVSGSKRSAPDVAYDANPSTGFAIYTSANYNGQSGWMDVGGTSAGAPQWAALIAIADQGRAMEGLPSLGNVNSLIYAMPSSAFHDITSGGNGAYSAGPGYDPVTGRGTPIANSVVNFLLFAGLPASAGSAKAQSLVGARGSSGKPSLAESDGAALEAGGASAGNDSGPVGEGTTLQGPTTADAPSTTGPIGKSPVGKTQRGFLVSRARGPYDTRWTDQEVPLGQLESVPSLSGDDLVGAGLTDPQADETSQLKRDQAFGAAIAEIGGTWRF